VAKHPEYGSPVQLAEALGAPRGELDAARVKPMLCSTDGLGLARKGYVYELKLDGARILAEKRGAEVRLFYRSGRDAAPQYPEIAEAVAGLDVDRVLLDGEIVALDDEGRPSFEKLQRRIAVDDKREVARARREVPVVFVAFDVLSVGPYVVTSLPLVHRRALLAAAVSGATLVTTFDGVEDDGTALFELCKARGLEGVVGKRLDGPYRPGDRTADWFKVKTEKDADFVVVGYTRGEGGRSRMGALDVASFDDAGELVLRGRVGSGLTERAIDKLLPLLDAIASKTPTSRGTYEPKVRVHVAPRYVVRVRYLGWSSDGKLRFPVFRGLRDDVPPGECREAPAAATPKACP
jgi:bifunctional non-homologous end joining protein LigD